MYAQGNPARPKYLSLLVQLALMGTLGSTFIPQAQAQESKTISYQQAALPLAEALNRVARQAGITLSFDAALVQGKQAPALQGSYATEAAIRALLAGSGLQLHRGAAGSYAIRAANVSSEAQLETVRVSAAANLGGSEATATSPVKGYVAKRSATATKTDTPIVETPQSVSVIGQNEMRARDAQSVSEALAYVPGVQVFRQGSRTFDLGGPEIRGFGGNVPTYRDGLVQFATGWVFTDLTEPYAIERIEVLRGPASSIYGSAELGGVVHYQSKRPQADQVQEIAANIGDRGQLGVRSDLGGELGKAQWRLVSQLGRIDNAVRYPGHDVAKRDTVLLAPSLSLDLSEHTKLTLLGEYLHKEGMGAEDYEITRADGSNTFWPMGDPRHDDRSQKQWRLGYELEHKLDNQWVLKHNLRVADAKVNMDSAYYADPDASGITAAYASTRNSTGRSVVADLNIGGTLTTGAISHQLLFGVDYLNYGFEESDRNMTFSGLDLNKPAPEYTQPFFAGALSSHKEEHLKTLGLYAQDQISFDRWRFTGGLRLDRVEHERTNRLAGTSSTTNDTALTGRVGINYLFDNGFAPYISYGTSFRPQAGSDRNGKYFDPTEGQQYEAGVRYQPQNGKGMVSAAIYQLTKSNVLTADPRNTPGESFQIATGEIRARGLELEARIEPLAGLNLIANYSYNPMKVTRSNGADLGKSPMLKSKHLASAWVDYTVQSGSLRGVGFGVGARYTGPQFKDTANTKSFAGRTSYDAAISYKHGQWQTRLNATNLTNARPVVYDAWGIQRAPARTVNLDVSYKF